MSEERKAAFREVIDYLRQFDCNCESLKHKGLHTPSCPKAVVGWLDCNAEEGRTKTPGVEMAAGRELDALIAEKVMGLHKVMELGFDSAGPEDEVWRGHNGAKHSERRPPPYSADITTAWKVLEKLGLSIGTCASGTNGKPAGYWVGYHGSAGRPLVADMENETAAFGETAPLAICRAALKACEVKL